MIDGKEELEYTAKIFVDYHEQGEKERAGDLLPDPNSKDWLILIPYIRAELLRRGIIEDV